MAIKLYGSVNGQSKEIKTLYGSVNGVSKEIKKLYGSVNGVSKLIYQSEEPTPGEAYGVVYYKATAGSTEILSVDLQSVAEFNSLCNSASGRWSATIGGGTVTVWNGYSNNDPNVIVGVDIGRSITSIGDYFLYYSKTFNQALNIPNSVKTIGKYCMRGCTTFNQSVTFPNALTSIGTGFLYECTAFNKPIIFPASLEVLPGYFLYGCTAFNQPITFLGDARITHNNTSYYFLYNCKAMVSVVNVGDRYITGGQNRNFATNDSSAACYTTGITIAGSQRAIWLSRNPNSNSNPYRKLLDAGY